ncbi:glycoside hydrolase family 2 protein [Rariglobus hedericola]|nr:sugar-binding domain-containing protein [Rariglobus hedericola]
MKHLNSSLAPASRSFAPASPTREVRSLDGCWHLAFDPENQGSVQGWQAVFPEEAIEADVPAVLELVRPGYDGVVWYLRRFELPGDWVDRTLRLRFDAAQYHAEVWLNGVRLGAHEGGFLPFEFDVSSKVCAGENTVVVRVVNPPMDREIDGFRCGAPLNQGPIPVGKAGWYYNFGGLWQSVSLIATDGLAITRITPEPSLARDEVVVKLAVGLVAEAGSYEIACEIVDADGFCPWPVARIRRRLGLGVNQLSLRIPLPGARRWSVEDPFLHTVRVTVSRDGGVCDSSSVRFGMREFTARGGRFELNGRPVMLKGFLHQGSYPRSLVRPQDRAFAERELRLVKENGFNFIRAHLQPALPEWLDLCDEIGLLVMAEPPIGWMERTPEAEQRAWREIKGLVERDAHHASVVVWCLMNEVFHLRGFSPQVVIGMTTRWLARLQKLDPTRPVIDVSGGHGIAEGGGAADMLPDTASQGRTALMTLPGVPGTQPVLDAHIYHEFPVPEEMLRRFREVGREGPLFFISEYGAPPVPPQFDEVIKGYSAEDRAAGLEDYRLHADFADSLQRHFRHPALVQACGTPRRFIEQCNRLRADEVYAITTALRCNPRMAGYCFCQLADASGELFGAVDVWRRPKATLQAITEASAAGTLAIVTSPRVAAPGAPVELELIWLGGGDDQVSAKQAYWSLELSIDGVVEKRWRGRFQPVSGTPRVLLKKQLRAPKRAGLWTWRAEGQAGDLVLHGRHEMRVVARPPRVRTAAVVGVPDSVLGAALGKLGFSLTPFGNNCREADQPVFLDQSRVCPSRQLWFEEMGQLRKMLQIGGCAVLFNPEMALLREVIPEAAVRMQPIMRAVGHVSNEVFGDLAGNGLMDFSWAELIPGKYDRVDDVDAAGGRVLAGALSFNMWTRPAAYFHGASVYSLPVGRGTLVVCHLQILPALAAGRPEAEAVLASLAKFATGCIRKPDTKRLLSRCIDPLVADLTASKIMAVSVAAPGAKSARSEKRRLATK